MARILAIFIYFIFSFMFPHPWWFVMTRLTYWRFMRWDSSRRIIYWLLIYKTIYWAEKTKENEYIISAKLLEKEDPFRCRFCNTWKRIFYRRLTCFIKYYQIKNIPFQRKNRWYCWRRRHCFTFVLSRGPYKFSYNGQNVHAVIVTYTQYHENKPFSNIGERQQSEKQTGKCSQRAHILWYWI